MLNDLGLGLFDFVLSVLQSCPAASAKLCSEKAKLGRLSNTQNESQSNLGLQAEGNPEVAAVLICLNCHKIC